MLIDALVSVGGLFGAGWVVNLWILRARQDDGESEGSGVEWPGEHRED